MRKFLAAALAAGAFTAGAAQAANTASTTFLVSATVQPVCTATANPLAFNAYTPGTGNVSASTTVSVKCTSGTAYTVALNGGSTAGGTIGQRLMASGASTLQYNLYTDVALTKIFGDGATAGSQTDSGTGTGMASAQTVNVYGQLPDNATNEAAPPGTYSDTITVTVAY